MDDWGSIPATGSDFFSSPLRLDRFWGAPTGVFYPSGKVAGAWNWLLSSICRYLFNQGDGFTFYFYLSFLN
jgi:hypothetical protein